MKVKCFISLYFGFILFIKEQLQSFSSLDNENKQQNMNEKQNF